MQFGDSVDPARSASLLAKAGSDKTVTLGVRPEDFDGRRRSGLPVTVDVVEELGADAYMYGTAEHNNEHQQIVARIDARMPVEKGSTIRLAAVPEKLHLFSTSTEERLTA